MTPLNVMIMTGGLVFGLTSVMAWLILYRAHARLQATLWALGGLCFCVGFLLFADRVGHPRLPKYVLANLLFIGALLLRVQALRLDLGLPPVRAWHWVLLLLPVPVVVGLAIYAHDSMYLLVVNSLSLCYAFWLARLAWQVGLLGPSISGKLLALVEFCWIGSVMLRILTNLRHWPNGLVIDTWDYALFSVLTVIVAVYSNLAYVGMVLDRSRAATRRALASQAAEAASREIAERHAAELQTMLADRDRLAEERNQLLQVMAHEIRQPLHNASGALQAAGLALRSPRADGMALAAERVNRADAVLGDVHSVLDNTLAATGLLARAAPLMLQDVDLRLVIDLALGDLPPAERARVRLELDAALHSAEVETGLVRLALRNLLRNAFGHGGPETLVTLRIAEHDDPPALWMSVIDNGPGAPDEVLRASDDVAVPRRPDGRPRLRGLGLIIVRRVMALHGGRLELVGQSPHGLAASMVFPLPGLEAEGPAAREAAQALTSAARNT